MLSRLDSQVNFIISGSTVANRRRLRSGEQQQHSRIEEAESQLYRDLAQTSGGQAVEVTTSEVSEAISVLTESDSASLVALPTSHRRLCSAAALRLVTQAFVPKLQVTLLQAARNPGQTDTFTFLMDQTVENPVVYITGTSVTFVLTSPTGNPAPCPPFAPLKLELNYKCSFVKLHYYTTRCRSWSIYFSVFLFIVFIQHQNQRSLRHHVTSCE